MERDFTLHVLDSVRKGFVELEALSPHLYLQRATQQDSGRFVVCSCSASSIEGRFAAMCVRLWKCVQPLTRADAPLPTGRSDEEHAYVLLFREFAPRLHMQASLQEFFDPVEYPPSVARPLILSNAIRCVIELLDRIIADVASGPPSASDLIDTETAAELAGVSRKTIGRWKKAELLRVHGDAELFSRAEVLERAPGLRQRRPRIKRRTNSRTQRDIAGQKPGFTGQKGT